MPDPIRWFVNPQEFIPEYGVVNVSGENDFLVVNALSRMIRDVLLNPRRPPPNQAKFSVMMDPGAIPEMARFLGGLDGRIIARIDDTEYTAWNRGLLSSCFTLNFHEEDEKDEDYDLDEEQEEDAEDPQRSDRVIFSNELKDLNQKFEKYDLIHMRVLIVSSDPQLLADIQAIIDRFPPTLRPPPKHKGTAYVLTKDALGNGFSLVPIGIGGSPLVEENYERDIVEGYHRIIADLTGDQPRGRLAIMEGPPGTGKTYFVKSLMAGAPYAMFVIVPPHLVEELASPELVQTFIQSQNSAGPTVLILEDADNCLEKRTKGNRESRTSIASVLNLSDGIVGSLLDLRILATTNASETEFDPAILRKGRLSVHLRIGKLSPERTRGVWKRIAPEKTFPESSLGGGATLAEIYGAMRE